VLAKSGLAFGESPSPLGFTLVKHKENNIMNLNIHRSHGVGGEGSYAYSLRVGGKLYLLNRHYLSRHNLPAYFPFHCYGVGIRSLHLERRNILKCKLKDTSKSLLVLYEPSKLLH
jgi:hypothetical protein